jgi:hypothetical protein
VVVVSGQPRDVLRSYNLVGWIWQTCSFKALFVNIACNVFLESWAVAGMISIMIVSGCNTCTRNSVHHLSTITYFIRMSRWGVEMHTHWRSSTAFSHLTGRAKYNKQTFEVIHATIS